MDALFLTVELLLRLLQLIMGLQLLFMFLPFDRNSGAMRFLRCVSEPLLAPARAPFAALGLSRELQAIISPLLIALALEGLILLIR